MAHGFIIVVFLYLWYYVLIFPAPVSLIISQGFPFGKLRSRAKLADLSSLLDPDCSHISHPHPVIQAYENAVFSGNLGNEWMNECEWICIYIPHISHIVSRRFTILIEWDRTSACKGASGCRYRFIFDLTHPPNPCVKCTMNLQIDHNTGNYVPYSFRQVRGFFNVPCWPCNTEDAGDGTYGL